MPAPEPSSASTQPAPSQQGEVLLLPSGQAGKSPVASNANFPKATLFLCQQEKQVCVHVGVPVHVPVRVPVCVCCVCENGLEKPVVKSYST